MVALFTALIAPVFFDWSPYRQDFERETSRIIGQKVEVLGETSVRLLPLPSVTFGGLAVGKSADGSPLMTVDQFAIHVELLPLLKGEINIVKMNLVRPRINLHVDENGAIAWTDRQELIVDPEQIKLSSVLVTNGEVKIQGLAGGRTLLLEQLDGKLSAKSLYGPWRINVDGYAGSKRARIEISTGRLQDDGSLRVKFSAIPADIPYRLSLDGPVRVHQGLLRWDGDYVIAANNNGSGNQKLKKALPILMQGKFGATPRIVEVPEYRLEIGSRDDPYTLTGSGALQIDQKVSFQVKADGRQIDLERVGNTNSSDQEKGLSLGERLGAIREIFSQVPIPDAEGTIDLSLPAIVAGDTLIREISTVISPKREGWEIKRLSAIFPGNTKFEARGNVALRNGFQFNGKLLAASRQPTGLATWLGKRSNPFIRKLRSAGFTADVNITDTQTSLENLELVLDSAVLTGRLQRLSIDAERPALIARLEGDEINLDDLRAIFALVAQDDSVAITSHDLDISLGAGKITGFGISADAVETRFRVAGGNISVEKLDASNFFGVTLSSSGRIDNLLTQPNGNFKLALNSNDPTRFLNFLQNQISRQLQLPLADRGVLAHLLQSPELVRDLDMVFELDARSGKSFSEEGSRGQASIRGTMGGTKVEIQLGFDGIPENFASTTLDVTSTLENDQPPILLRQLGLDVLPIKVDGPIKVTSNFSGKAQDGYAGFVDARLLDTNIRASGTMFVIDERKGDANFELTMSSKRLDPLLAMAGIGSQLQVFSNGSIPASFSGNVSILKNHIVLSSGKGQIKGGEFSTEFDFERNDTSNNRVKGKLSVAALDLGFIAGMAFTNIGTANIEPVNGWDKSNFGNALMQGIDGEIDVSIARSDFGLGKPAQKLNGKLALVDGSINLNDFSGEWLGGQVSGNMSFTNGQGIGALSSQFKITNIEIEKLLAGMDAPEFAVGKGDILGSLEGSGRSPAAIVSSLIGSGTIDLQQMSISGFNTRPMGHIIEKADKKGFEILDENVLAIVEEVISDGTVFVDEISIPFIVTAGKLQARNIPIEARDTKMVGAIRFDVANKRLSSQLSVRFDPGIEWVDGDDPQIVINWDGGVDAPTRTIDVQPMSGYLSLRSFEREQRRVDLLQASILEKQRLRRDIIITNARVRYRQRLREEELRRQRQAFLQIEEDAMRISGFIAHQEMLTKERAIREEELRKIAEAERKAKEEAARLAAEKEAKRVAEAKRIAAQAERKRIEKEAKLAAEAEARRVAEAKRIAAEAEAARQKQAAKLAAQAKLEREAEEKRQKERERNLANERARLEEERAKAEAAAIIEAEKLEAEQVEKPASERAATPVKRKLSDKNFADRLRDFLSER